MPEPLWIYLMALLYLTNITTCSAISEAFDSASHDQLTRMLQGTWSGHTLLNLALRLLFTVAGGYLILDDTVVEKPYARLLGEAAWVWSSKRPLGGLWLLLDVFHGLPVTFWAVNLRHAAPILTTKLGRANRHINDRFIDQHLFTTDPTAVEIFFWRGPKGDVDALSGVGLMRVLSHTSLF